MVPLALYFTATVIKLNHLGNTGVVAATTGSFCFFISQETTTQIILTIIKSLFIRFQILFTSQYCNVTTFITGIRNTNGCFLKLKAFLLFSAGYISLNFGLIHDANANGYLDDAETKYCLTAAQREERMPDVPDALIQALSVA
jgi:hypothetical protein